MIELTGPFRQIATTSAILFALNGCVSPETTGTVAGSEEGEAVQPRMATYQCGEGAAVTVENLGESVRVAGPDGTTVELPAAPSDQRSRFGLASEAIVLDGREALYMAGGSEPLTCLR